MSSIATILDIKQTQEYRSRLQWIFDFPPAVAPACEQYLIYFSQFLADIGISTTNDIKHEAGRILFTVTPTDPTTALDKIREALNVYMHLPAIVDDSELPMAQEIPVQAMMAQIQSYKAQIMWANAVLAAKGAENQFLQKTIDLLSLPTAGTDILVSSASTEPKFCKPEETEIMGGLVLLGDAELLKSGVKIRLGRVYQKLREWWREG